MKEHPFRKRHGFERYLTYRIVGHLPAKPNKICSIDIQPDNLPLGVGKIELGVFREKDQKSLHQLVNHFRQATDVLLLDYSDSLEVGYKVNEEDLNEETYDTNIYLLCISWPTLPKKPGDSEVLVTSCTNVFSTDEDEPFYVGEMFVY